LPLDPDESFAPSERIVYLSIYPGFRFAPPWAKLCNRFAVNPTGS
jgi:hypothetical protein